ncbi:ROK family protein [Cytobacillus oceanisediminis]|uniref:Putative NBD/HSP70 family sugar kinase n=1 Tax=Cytobacillus oceanisediminis TaxID=665099 RepID=A0A562JIJ1_9BACI|nr:ROK family protein [Cytobacillus oceanisediminis]TWH82969.1 putative NBD/HSP70 family sugar kinase [Cytobacillus oceanisediminis]
MVTGDAGYIKKINRSVILSKIIEHKLISRAELAKVTGLNKATISVQVSDLLAESLIIESQLEHNNIGRRPIMLSINPQAGFVLGIDLDRETITFQLADLMGRPVSTEVVQLETSNYDVILTQLILNIKEFEGRCSHSLYGLTGVVIGIHGIVNIDETIYFVPHLQWKNKDLKKDLLNGLELNIFIENNANLCAFAEKIFNYHRAEYLLTVTLYSGIGLGNIVNGETLKGFHGYAGEIGHMIVVPYGKPCSCGNRGCWEQYASESGFMKILSDRTDERHLQHGEIQQWIAAKETITCSLLEDYIKFLSIGVNNIINLYNPEILVLNSELLRLYPDAITEIKSLLSSSVGHCREIELSHYGKQACIMGACALAIKNFLGVSELRLSMDDVS